MELNCEGQSLRYFFFKLVRERPNGEPMFTSFAVLLTFLVLLYRIIIFFDGILCDQIDASIDNFPSKKKIDDPLQQN